MNPPIRCHIGTETNSATLNGETISAFAQPGSLRQAQDKRQIQAKGGDLAIPLEQDPLSFDKKPVGVYNL